MVRSRTRVLFAISSLAPASILIWRLHVEFILKYAKGSCEAARRGWPYEFRYPRRETRLLQRRRRVLARPALFHLSAFRDRRGYADPYLLHRIHGARRRLLSLLRIHEPVHVFDAYSHPRE